VATQNSNNTAGHVLKDEARLLQELIGGSMDAFTALYDHYQPRLRVFIAPFTHQSPSLTNDIIQEVFIKLWVKRDNLAGVQHLEFYLQRMARNRLLDIARLRKIKLRHETSFAALQVQQQPVTEDTLQLKEYHQLAQDAIRQLPERRRYLFTLHVLEGYSLDEIGQITGLSKEVIKKQLFKARHSLRQQLKKKAGFQLPPCILFF
jgi:RNA polymerase sigma-70 factor (ECF subfamily)